MTSQRKRMLISKISTTTQKVRFVAAWVVSPLKRPKIGHHLAHACSWSAGLLEGEEPQKALDEFKQVVTMEQDKGEW
jgi:hypothetical protein